MTITNKCKGCGEAIVLQTADERQVTVVVVHALCAIVAMG